MDTTTTAGTPSTVQGGQAGRQHSAGLVEFVEKLEDIHPVVRRWHLFNVRVSVLYV